MGLCIVLVCFSLFFLTLLRATAWAGWSVGGAVICALPSSLLSLAAVYMGGFDGGYLGWNREHKYEPTLPTVSADGYLDSLIFLPLSPSLHSMLCSNENLERKR